MAITKQKGTARPATEMEEATLLLAQYRSLHLSQQSLQQQKKEIEAQLYALCERNREKWFGTKNTLQLDVHGKLAYVNETYIIYDADLYSEKDFASAYPELVEIKPRTSALKGYCINAEVREEIAGYGLKLDTREKFTVTPNK